MVIDKIGRFSIVDIEGLCKREKWKCNKLNPNEKDHLSEWLVMIGDKPIHLRSAYDTEVRIKLENYL